MPTPQTDSKKPSTGSEAWTAERIKRMERQDQASTRIRRSLGQVVAESGSWQRMLEKQAASSATNG